MARNRIEELLVQLKFQGAEELSKISSGFRELAKAVNLADGDIEDARTKIIDYGKTLGNTNQAVKGTIQALKALQDSTNRGGEAWVRLSRDVLGFEQAARLTDREIELLRRGIVAEANAHSQSETSIRAHVRALQELRAQSVLGGQVNRQLAQSIGQLTQQLNQAEQASRAHFSALNQALAVRPDAVLRQFQAYTQVLRDVRATAEQAAEAQQRLNQLAGAPRIAARRELVARTGIQSDPAYQERFGLGGRSLEELPGVPAALSLRLRELQEDLNFTTRNTRLYVSTLVEMASVQRQASATTQGFAAALREQLASGQLAPTQKNLQEVIGALRREMLELDTTTTEGGRAYAENARQADVLERQLRELASSYRNVADMAVQAATAERSAATARVTALYMGNKAVREQARAMRDLGDAVRSGVAATPLMLPAAGQTTAPGSGQARSGGARLLRGQVETTFGGEGAARTPWRQRDLPSAAVGAPPALGMSSEGFEAQIKMQAKAAKDAAADLSVYRIEVQRAAAANNGSINSIQRYRDSLVTLRNTLPATGAEFKQLGRQVQQLDAQLERSQSRRRRLGAMEATQAAGAVISGGIFGGPEGAIGGAVGTAIGGVPGAFAGAAIGAQVGMIRQSLGEMASFTAEIDKQRIALRNVVGSQQEYQNSLQFIDAASRRLAIPQDQLNKQFTQLSASVIGAGGNVDAAKVAFEGIAAGIRGTGGSLGDMESALLATSQVFSKGKVSAEELRQQIGERLPGAFTIFAQSIGKTPQELDKMLEKGEVTLNDFMTFVQALSQRYGASANEIAASSQSAGDRMATTFARIREAVGRELQPVGAQFQATFADLFEEAEPTLVNFARGISAALTSFGAVASSFVTATKPIRDFIQFYSAAFPAFWRSIGDDVETLIGRIRSLFEGVFNFWQNIWNSLRAASTSALKSIGIDADFLARQFGQIIGWLQNAWSTAFTFIQVRWRQTVQNMINYSNPLAAVLKGFGVDVGKAVTSGMSAGMATGQGGGVRPVAPIRPAVPFTFPGGDASGAGTGAGGAKPAQAPEDRTGDLRDQLKLLTAMSEVEDMIRDLRFQGRDALAIEAEQYKQMIQIEYDRAQALKQTNYESERGIVNETARQKLVDLDKKTQDELRALAAQRFQEELRVKQAVQSAVEPFRSLRVQQELQAQYSKTYYRLLTEGMLPAEAERIAGFEKMVAEQRGALDLQIQITEAALQEALARTEGAAAAAELRKELKKLRAQRGAVDGAAAEGPGEGPSQADRARQAIANVRAELNSLVDPVNQVVSAATAIGDAFGNSFKGVITGTMTAREALASFFSSVADSFADMAAKMIAEWIKLTILNTVLKLFPGSGASLGFGGASDPLGAGGAFWNANGNAFAQNGIVPYAKGGVVNRPTMFKFARGGAMSTGVMGEAGPEAIMPLKRGADGKLGVAAAGGSGVTVNVSVDAKGTQVQGDPGQGAQLGRVIAGAVQQELIKQQRPGGLLAGAK